MKFPTGGIVRDPFLGKRLCMRHVLTQRWLIWCNSKTDSKVWMREEKTNRIPVGLFMQNDKPRMKLIRGFYHTKRRRTFRSMGVLPGRETAEREENMEQNLWTSVKNNLVFVLSAVAIAIVLVLIAYAVEKMLKKKHGDTERVLATRKIAMIGLFSAIAGVLQVLEFQLPFTPPFYKFDFSDLPALIGGFAFGPVAGVMIEFIKNVIKMLLKPTSTAFVGEFANFVVGCSFVLTASIIYLYRKSRKSALAASVFGTIVMTIFGSLFNAVYLLPTFAVLFHMPLEEIVAMGNAVNGNINSITSLVILAVAPLNILKGAADSLITMLIYKKISPIMKGSRK